jgi:hypothetical protein
VLLLLLFFPFYFNINKPELLFKNKNYLKPLAIVDFSVASPILRTKSKIISKACCTYKNKSIISQFKVHIPLNHSYSDFPREAVEEEISL